MDPNACVRDMLDYIRAGEMIEAQGCLWSLFDWEAKGGFKPDWFPIVAGWVEKHLMEGVVK